MPFLASFIVSFFVQIVVLLWQSISDSRYADLKPQSTAALSKRNGATEPTEEAYAALVADLIEARRQKTIGRVATRVNRELSDTRSLFISTARRAAKLEAPNKDALVGVKEAWGEIETRQAMKVAFRVYTLGYLL